MNLTNKIADIVYNPCCKHSERLKAGLVRQIKPILDKPIEIIRRLGKDDNEAVKWLKENS